MAVNAAGATPFLGGRGLVHFLFAWRGPAWSTKGVGTLVFIKILNHT